MNDIFINYSSSDRPWVAMLAKALGSEGYSVRWNQNDLTTENILDNNKCVITVWSHHAVQSFGVQSEALKAMEQRLLVPVLCEQVAPPMPYASLTSEAMQNWNGNREEQSYQHLLQTISKFTQPEIDLKKGKYLDNNDDTITDYSTHLMWKKYSEGQRTIACGKGMVRQYTWDNAVRRFRQVSFAGYNDWRLPTIDELRSLVHCDRKEPLIETNKTPSIMEKQCMKPAIDNKIFPNTSPTRYWTSSTFYNKDEYAWSLHFDSGNDEENLKYYNASVRLVRKQVSSDKGYIKLLNRTLG
jgi:hypothetical protein